MMKFNTRVINGEVVLTSAVGCDEVAIIPSEVTVIDIGAFEGNKTLREVQFPEGLKRINGNHFSGAFMNCTRLETITLPKGLKGLDRNAFSGCSSLQTITLPEGLEEIGGKAFFGCSSLRTIALPKGLKELGWNAFEDCSSLQSITLPMGLEVLNIETFKGCRNLQSITLPEGLKRIERDVFFDCRSLRSITLPEGLKRIGSSVFWYCSRLQSVTLPEGLETIESNAFADCSSLQTITLPDSLKEIRWRAFERCSGLQTVILPKGIMKIEERTFAGCSSLRTITLPEGLEEIGSNAFEGCSGLQTITLPEGLKGIGKKAFMGCSSLQTITLPDGLERISQGTFSGCSSLQTIALPDGLGKIENEAFSGCANLYVKNVHFRTVEPLPNALCDLNLEPNDEEIAYVALYQKSDKWKKWLNRVRLDDPVHVFNCMIELWLQDKSVTSRLTSFMIDRIAKLQMEQVQQVVLILQKRGTKAQIQSVMDSPEVALLAKGEPIPKHPIEALVSKLVPFYAREVGQIDEIVTGIHYANSELRSSRDAVVLLIAAGFREADQKIDNFGEGSNMRIKGKLCLDDDLLRVANSLNRSELLEQLVNLYKNAKTQNMKYLLAWALLADDASIRKETVHFKEKREGKRQPIAEVNAARFLMYNDSLAAMQLFDRLNLLDEYAQMRGMTAMEMRDSAMLPDFHFDADGAKRYDIGGNIIEARITPELKFQLFDANKGKELRSFPKKSDDPEKLAACAAEYDKFKWDALSLAKERAQLLHKLHMSGEFIQPELWHKVYVEHQLIRHLAQLVVWEDQAKRTFMTVDGETIDSQGQTYSPQGAIRVAHVLDMTAQDIAAWQLWLTRQGKKQLFEQVWEPVILWDKEGIQSRYDGVVLSSSARNAVKKRLAQRGVDVWAEDMARSYNRQSNSFSFSNKSVLHFGHCLALNYKVDDASRETTFGSAREVDSTSYRREMNAVLLEMDRAAVSAQILRDDDSALTDAALASFTVAQISEFLNLAIDQKCTRCTAKLLDYKNQRFPEFSEMDVFTLDW